MSVGDSECSLSGPPFYWIFSLWQGTMGKNWKKEFRPENFPNYSINSAYYILKISVQTDASFLRLYTCKNHYCLTKSLKVDCFLTCSVSWKRSIGLSWNFQDIISTVNAVIGKIFRPKFLLSVFFIEPYHRLKIQ